MNNEIKAIIKYIKLTLDVTVKDMVLLNRKDIKQLLDYITNLQQENQRLKELCDKYEEEHSTEFKIWKDERQQLLDYKSRCDKVIEYLELRRYSNEDGKPSLDLDEYDCVPLLNILQGVSNENKNKQ